MEFRKADELDKEGIGKVLMQCYNIDSIEEGVSVFLGEVDKGYNFLVAEDAGKIVGLTNWTMHGLVKHGLVELDRIAVLFEFRQKGVGRGLFDFLIENAKEFYSFEGGKLRKVYLMTHADNFNAQEFYGKLGLKKEAVLKDHFYDGKDELIMSVFVKGLEK